ncbi:MAG: glycosyltransferase [Trichocoleus desertorum ATA4-8-CV12]|jgi:glycosyltransferase involved in cell wall biosynthesis|nr:glycosyltransferase [Trichocoleus desertorum ATA4-8-CV12]
MSDSILFSVIVPTYHRNNLLAKCLDCLAPEVQILPANQYEVIVTDDGSTTTAEQMILEGYHWVRWVMGPRKGPAANRNNGARYAQGSWLVFTDDDCLPNSGWLSSFAAAIVPDTYVYEGRTICEAGIHSPLEHAPINLTGGYLWSCNMMVQTKLFQELNGFDENFPHPHMEDVDLRDRIQLAGYMFNFIENAVVEHPVKKFLLNNKIGKLHECEIYYWHRKRKQKFRKSLFLFQLIKVRVRTILRFSLSWDSVIAVASLMLEILYVLRKLSYWYQKYPLETKLE